MSVTKQSGDDVFCRICRSCEGGQIPIFGVYGAERAIPEKIHTCLPIKVSQKDGLPQTICSECATKLEDFFQFRELACKTDSAFSGICSSESIKSDSDLSNSKVSEKERGDLDKKKTYSQLSEPMPEDYVLMKEETINVDNTYKTSTVMADYLIEFNNNTKVKTEAEIADRDIILAMRRRREVLPPMWDVFERVQTDQERQTLEKVKGSKQALRTALKGKFSVIHRRYIITKGSFPCSLCGRCFRVNQGTSRPCEDSGDESSPSDVFRCAQCDMQFTQYDELQNHEKSHINDQSFTVTSSVSITPSNVPGPTCAICNKTFSRNEHLVRHMQTHTGGRPYECDVCQKVFTRKEHLLRHKMTHNESAEPEEKPYVCDLCPAAHARRELLVKHKKVVHNVEEEPPEVKPYVCDHCFKTFTRKEHLVRHKKIHMREIPLTVNTPQVVKQVGKDTVTLEISANPGGESGASDMVNTILEQGRYGQVSIEPKITSTPTNSSETPYYAPDDLTDEQRAQLEGFLDSSIAVDTELMVYEPECPPVSCHTPTDDYLEEKESIDLEDLKKMPKCRICAKAFTKKNHLNRHLKRYHNLTKEQVNSGKYEMYENGEPRTFEDGEEGDDLIDDEGGPILKRPRCSFPCSICRKTFTRKYHMYRHQKTQHGIEFPTRDQQKDEVKCNECGLIFLSAEDLANHECVDDFEEREPARRKPASAGGTFKCAICKATFESHDGFKDHECKKSHTCNICGETFDRLRLLNKHMESHAADTAAATATITASV